MSVISPIFSRESRLGLVLYGGVSLAIYMNGVCQEFYNAVRGRGIYKLIKILTDSDIVIDIVSGTSAGGVNGILLSYAIANSTRDVFIDFKDFAKLWIDSADVSKLLPAILDAKKYLYFNKKINSVFNGDFYQKKLEEAFKDEFKYHPKDEWYSDFSELDLFVSATDLAGRIDKASDNTGRIIEVKDHRTVFHLKYRREQADFIDNPFNPGGDTRKALAKLCRITSCFPVAFPIVEVNIDLEDKPSQEDKKLIEWGKLRNREGEKNKLYFVDGGVLSNRPFTSTIKAIYGRTAYRPVDRKLFYVDPEPETFLDKESEASTANLPWLVAWKSKIAIPNYQSISKDLEAIKEGNRKVIRQQLLKDSLEMSWQEILDSYPNFDLISSLNKPEVFNYLKCRFISLLENSINEILKPSFEQSDTKESLIKTASDLLNARNVQIDFQQVYSQISPWDIEFIIRKHRFLLEITSQEIQKAQNSQTSGAFDFYTLAVCREVEPLGLSLLWVMLFPKENNSKKSQIKQYLGLRYLAYQLSWQLELLKIIQRSIYQIFSGYELNEIPGINGTVETNKISSIYEFLENVYETLLKINDKQKQLLDSYYELIKIIHFPNDIEFEDISWADLNILLPEQESPERKKEIFTKIYQMPVCEILSKTNQKDQFAYIKNLKDKIKENQKNSGNNAENILQIIDAHSMDMIENAYVSSYGLQLKEFSEQYELIDMILYPYDYLSDIVTKNTIQIVRISPDDDKDSEKSLGVGKGKNIEKKLKGYKFHAFGGFFNQSWRMKDILWGRLDGLSRIVEALVTPASIKNFKEFIGKYPEYQWEDLIPEGEEKAHIIGYLEKFKQDSNYLNENNFKELLDQIVILGQRQILVENLGNNSKSNSRNNLMIALEDLGKQKPEKPILLSWIRIFWLCLRMIRFLIPGAIIGAILGLFVGLASNSLANNLIDQLGDACFGLIAGLMIGLLIGVIVTLQRGETND